MSRKKKKYDLLAGLRDDIDFLFEKCKVTIIEALTKTMEAKNISRAELARRLGTSPAYVTKIFRMNINFTLKSLIQIAHVLDMKIDFTFYKAKEPSEWLNTDIYRRIKKEKVTRLSLFPSKFTKKPIVNIKKVANYAKKSLTA